MTHHALIESHTLVLFSDQSDEGRWLVSAFAHERYRVIVVASVAELDALEQEDADFVIFDVTPKHLLPALQALRARARWQDTPALVRAERLDNLTELAGVGPSYRALICHHVDLLTLLNHHTRQTAAPDKPHHLL